MNKIAEAIDHDNLIALEALLKIGEIDLGACMLSLGEEYGEDVDDVPVLFYAIGKRADLEQIELLIAYGADIHASDKNGVSFVDIAVKYRRLDLLELSLRNNMDIVSSYRKSGLTPLMLASCYGDMQIAEFLLAHGADINTKDAGGMRAKDYARKLGQKNMQAFLTAKGGLFAVYKE